MFERYTEGAKRTVFFARYEAGRLGSDEITPDHLLLGLLHTADPSVSRFIPVDKAETVRNRIQSHIPLRPPIPKGKDLPLSKDGKILLANAASEAGGLSHWHIGSEHFLLAILRQKRWFAAKVLREQGLEYSEVRAEIARDTGD